MGATLFATDGRYGCGENERTGGFYRLALGAIFYLDRSVREDQAPGNGIAPSSPQRIHPVADTQDEAAFTTTHWSVVLAAQGPSPAAEEALDKLCRTYWRPIYGFVRRQGVEPEEAKDLTQGFFALLLERRDLETVRKEKGRLRSYLLISQIGRAHV